MVCAAWFERISAAVDGELDDGALQDLDDHCSTCPSCTSARRRLEDLRRRSLVRIPHEAPELTATVLGGEAAARLRARTRRRGAVLAVAAVVIVASLAFAGPLRRSPSTPRPSAGGPTATTSVTIKTVDDSFDQRDLRVVRGTTIQWTNDGNHTHRLVRHLGGELVSSDLAPGRTETITFNQDGNYEYYCSVHRGMTGRILVSS